MRAADATALDLRVGITRILVGLTKKFAIADLMTAFTNHLNTADIAQADRRVLPLWLLAYGVKIYFDFAGYSDIAIGSARLFGIAVPENFDWPYFRANIAEFWRYWHISLSRWLLDYVFIPLGGSRVAPPRICANLIVTMFVSGVWHGAGTNFVVWGLWHGMLLAGHRIWRTAIGETSPTAAGAISNLAIDLRHGQPGLGVFLHGSADGAIFPEAAICGLKMATLIFVKQLLDYLGGAQDSPPAGAPRFLSHPVFLGVLWGVLAIAIMMFSGQTSRFIYIDF